MLRVGCCARVEWKYGHSGDQARSDFRPAIMICLLLRLAPFLNEENSGGILCHALRGVCPHGTRVGISDSVECRTMSDMPYSSSHCEYQFSSTVISVDSPSTLIFTSSKSGRENHGLTLFE